MSLPQNNKLPISRLAGIFSNTTATYKFYWFVALLDCVVKDRHLHIKAKELLDGVTPTSTPLSTPSSIIPENENIKRLISAIAEEQLSVKEMMAAVGLKDRPNFIEYSLSPAMREGYVRMLYPDSPRHPRQKYLLTVKGLAAYKEL